MTTAFTSTRRLRRTFVAVTATTVLVLAGCGDDEPTRTTPAPSDSPSASESSSQRPKRDKKTTPPAPVDEVVVDVAIVGDDVTPVAQSVDLGVGETLLLEVESDRAGELHVHSSPEQFADFPAGSSRLDFKFDKPGSVDVEEHDSGALIVRVLVK